MIFRRSSRIARPHVCGRCGGFDRRWLRDNRRRLGIGWLHGACQCCAACSIEDAPEAWMVELDGVDDPASRCDCDDDFQIEVTEMSVDGVYGPVPFRDQDPVSGSCVYTARFEGPTATYINCGSVTPRVLNQGIDILIHLHPTVGISMWVNFLNQIDPEGIPTGGEVYSGGGVGGPEGMFGQPTSSSCGFHPNRALSDGGTADVYPA